MFLQRGFAFTHEAVRDWETRFAPLIGDQLRRKRRGQASPSWHVDAHVWARVHGKWCYLYRAIDQDGNLVDSMLSAKRNMDAAQRFFQQALDTVGRAPERVTTDGHDSSPRAIREALGDDVLHRCSHYLNNLIEQDHRGIRTAVLPHARVREASCRLHVSVEYLMRVRQFFRFRITINQKVSPSATTRDVPSTIGDLPCSGFESVIPRDGHSNKPPVAFVCIIFRHRLPNEVGSSQPIRQEE